MTENNNFEETASEDDWKLPNAGNTPTTSNSENYNDEPIVKGLEYSAKFFDKTGITWAGIIMAIGLLFFQFSDEATFILIAVIIALAVLIIRYYVTSGNDHWALYEDHLVFVPIETAERIEIYYINITAFQMRHSMPSSNRMGKYFPAQRYLCFWVKHNDEFQFQESDFSNFDELVAVFTEQMNKIGIQESEYRV